MRPIERFDANVVGTADYADTADSDVVVVTAGMPRKPGMSRDDLIATNVQIVRTVAEQVAKYSPNCVMIVVSNPLDAMVYTAWKASGFPTNRILGQAGCLDVARFRCFIAMELGCSVEDIQALLLGGHGDDMVPLPRYTSVHGIPVTQLLPEETINACVERAKVGGGEIVKLMGTSRVLRPGQWFHPDGRSHREGQEADLAVCGMVRRPVRRWRRLRWCAVCLGRRWYGEGHRDRPRRRREEVDG